ncbi:MAG: aldehyde dehydrogenase family protein [Acidobacteriaceae bacterium]
MRMESQLRQLREAQREWSAMSIRHRLRILKRARHLLAAEAEQFIPDISPDLVRSPADTLAAEVLPVLAACEFLEREAPFILRPRILGRRGLPLWLWGVRSEIHRVPMGVVLIIGASNYPLLLAGAQALQALAAGNAVVWKPGTGGRAVAERLARLLARAGLPDGLLLITDESPDAAQQAIAAGADKVFFTGSAATGRIVMRQLAEMLTPSVMELSGCDAVFVLDGADLHRAADALAFGVALNGSATCMASRRLFATSTTLSALLPLLQEKLRHAPQVPLLLRTRHLLDQIIADARARGATVLDSGSNSHPSSHTAAALHQATPATLILNATPDMLAMQADIFAPLLSLCVVESEAAALAAYARCSYALTAAVFGAEREALALARQLEAGSVLVNDLIAPTVDPRVPFGGRRDSGFGVTRGAEGLLEMTAIKVVLVRRGNDKHHYAKSTDAHTDFFAGYMQASHGKGLGTRWRGFIRALKAATKIG